MTIIFRSWRSIWLVWWWRMPGGDSPSQPHQDIHHPASQSRSGSIPDHPDSVDSGRSSLCITIDSISKCILTCSLCNQTYSKPKVRSSLNSTWASLSSILASSLSSYFLHQLPLEQHSKVRIKHINNWYQLNLLFSVYPWQYLVLSVVTPVFSHQRGSVSIRSQNMLKSENLNS